jgi:C1A family cysteine protease
MTQGAAVGDTHARPRRGRGYGWVPDVPDQRDHLYALARRRRIVPATIDLRGGCSPVENQGRLNSCTGNALVGALEFLEIKDRLRFVNLSRLFVYYNERAIEHSTRVDAGAALRDGIKSLARQGVCRETMWPYRTTKVLLKPTKRCYVEAAAHRITSYQRLSSVDAMRSCLAEGYPFVFGFAVYESFESARVARSGIVPLPKPDEVVVGGHAVMAVGYDDAKRTFIVRNSWGAKWGKAGYCAMPYDYLADRNLSDDFWTIRR